MIKKFNNNKQNNNLKDKLINNLMIGGNKKTCEKIILLNFKLFQKTFFINHRKTIQLAVINTTPPFLIRHLKKLKRKKRKESQIPFLPKKNIRISFAIKNILIDSSKKNVSKFYINLTNEIVASAQKKSEAIKKKNEIQEQAIKQKKLARFRWF
jgi:ribosomal protein S7